MSDWNRSFNDRSVPATEQIMESENNRMADQLANKVSRLKMISLDMKDGIEDDSHYLDGMDSDFLSTTGLLGGSVTRFSKMMSSGKGNRKMLCYLVAFAVSIFFLIYFLLSRTKA